MLRSTEQSSRELNEACPWNRLKSLEIVNMPTFADFFSFNSPDKRQFLFGQWEKTGKEFVIGFISLEQRSYLFVAPEFRVLPPNPQTGKAALPLQPMHGLAQASRFRCCVSDCNFLGWCNMMRRGHSASIVTPSLNWHPTHIQHHISHLFIILITISVHGYGYIYIYIYIYMIWYDMIWYDDMIYVYIYIQLYTYVYVCQRKLSFPAAYAWKGGPNEKSLLVSKGWFSSAEGDRLEEVTYALTNELQLAASLLWCSCIHLFLSRNLFYFFLSNLRQQQCNSHWKGWP